MFIHFLCLCPLRLAIMLSFNIAKLAYCKHDQIGLVQILDTMADWLLTTT